MQTVKADGVLRHCFWGTYNAQVILKFLDTVSASDAKRTLGDIWKVGDTSSNVLTWIGDSAQLDELKLQFKKFGVQVHKCGRKSCKTQCKEEDIDSTAHSVDYGPNFSISIPIIPTEQLVLF